MIPEIWQGHLNNGAKFANSIIRFSEKLSEINQQMSNRFQILKERIKGPVFSVITPFDKDGEIDFQSKEFIDLLKKYI